MENEAKRRLKDFQEKIFKKKELSEKFQGFDLRAYPETAKGFDLDFLGIAIKVFRNKNKDGVDEMEESYRARILLALDTPDPETEEAA